MPLTLNRKAYLNLINEDLQWLLNQPRTLERDHIEHLLRWVLASNELDRCEHGVEAGDWCEPCNREYKRAAADEVKP